MAGDGEGWLPEEDVPPLGVKQNFQKIWGLHKNRKLKYMKPYSLEKKNHFLKLENMRLEGKLFVFKTNMKKEDKILFF